MATCPKCGAQAADDAKLCPACGATLEPKTGAPSLPASPTPPPGGGTTTGAQGGMSPGMAALLVYIPFCLIGVICAVLFGFILEPYKRDRYIRFHAFQSLALHVSLIVLWVGVIVFSSFAGAVVHILVFLIIPLELLLGLGILILFVFMMIKANGMQMYKLPVIGDWAEKQANS